MLIQFSNNINKDIEIGENKHPKTSSDKKQHFNLLHKESPAVLQAGVWLPEVNLLFTGTLVLELKALMVREHS